MIVLMQDTYRHRGTYPRYTLALAQDYSDYPLKETPCIIRQYAPTDIIVDVYASKESAYHVFKLYVDEEQPFVPVLDRIG